jgi:hypothetical protein
MPPIPLPKKNQFIVDDVSKIIKEAIESTIGGNAYQHDKGKTENFFMTHHG